jgi:hypothetical protein
MQRFAVILGAGAMALSLVSVAAIDGAHAAEIGIVIAPGAPPAPRAETVPPPPGPPGRVVWVHGRWNWDGRAWVWLPGHYIDVPRRHARWIEGHWRRTPRGWVWVEGHWR